MRSYGVTRTSERTEPESVYIHEILNKGFTVIPDVLTTQQVDEASFRLDSILRKQEAEYSESDLKAIGEEDMVRAPLAYDDFFIDTFLIPEKLKHIIPSLVGDVYQLQLQNGIINRPSTLHHQSSWHRDLPYQDIIVSKPISVSVLFCLCDFKEINGATEVIPFSHKIDHLPSEDYIGRNKQTVTATSGSVILFDSLLYHRAGVNSSNEVRRGINHVFTIPLIRQQLDIPNLLNGKYSENEFLNGLLGYKYSTPLTVSDFRNRRLNKLMKV